MAHQADLRWILDNETILRERYRMHAADGMDLSPERIAQLQERAGPERRVEIALNGGETIDLGEAGLWRVVHTPGHSPGHVALFEERRKWAIVADAVLGSGLTNTDGLLVSPPPYYDCRAYVQTVRTIMEWAPVRLFTGHFPPMAGREARDFLLDSLDAVERIRDALRKAMSPGGAFSLRELCGEVGSRSGQWPETAWPTLVDPVSAHLREWIVEGRVRRTQADGKVVYRFDRNVV